MNPSLRELYKLQFCHTRRLHTYRKGTIILLFHLLLRYVVIITLGPVRREKRTIQVFEEHIGQRHAA